MEKVKTVERKETVNIYKFYCDDCGKLIMSSKEFDDGYIPEPKEPSYQLHLNKWFKYNGHLCEACWKKKIDKIIRFLKENGFQEN